MIASQYFLLSRQLRMVFIYICQIDGETFNPIGILWYKYDSLPKYGKIPQFLTISRSKKHHSNHPQSTSHFELPSVANMPFINEYAKLFLAILVFKCLRAVTTLLSCVTFLLINITGLV